MNRTDILTAAIEILTARAAAAAERYDSAPQRRSEVFPFFPAPTPERIAARAEFEALGAAIAKFDSERYASLSDDERALDA